MLCQPAPRTKIKRWFVFFWWGVYCCCFWMTSWSGSLILSTLTIYLQIQIAYLFFRCAVPVFYFLAVCRASFKNWIVPLLMIRMSTTQFPLIRATVQLRHLIFEKKNTKITRTLTATIDIPRILTYLHIRIEWLTAKAKYQQQTERKWNVSGETEPYNNCLPPNCVFCVWYALKWFIRLETDCCL